MKITIRDVDPYDARCFFAWIRNVKITPAEAFHRMIPKESRYCLEEEIGRKEADECFENMLSRIRKKRDQEGAASDLPGRD